MKRIKNVLAGVLMGTVFLVGAVLAVASRQPGTYRVVRTGLLEASPAEVYPFLNDLSRWNRWSPWRDLDPEQKMTYSENPVGKGAWVSWAGNSKAGKGRMTILDTVPDRKVVEELHFIEPFDDIATVTFELSGNGIPTQLTWSMEGKLNLFSKVMCLFVSMDQMIGPDFERGIENLRALLGAQADPSGERPIQAEQG